MWLVEKTLTRSKVRSDAYSKITWLKEDSVKEESFSNGLLEYPQYTRPEIFQGEKVPEILLTGHHGNIEKWRQEQAFKITKQKRPDLLKEKGNNEVQI